MRLKIMIGLLIISAAALAGCSRTPASKESPKRKDAEQQVKAPEHKKPPKEEDPALPPPKKESQLTRFRDIISYRPYFHGLGLAYKQIALTGTPPQKKEDFRGYLDPEMTKLIDDGYVKVIYNVSDRQMPHGAANTIIAYEVREDPRGLRLVLMGDGTPKEMNNEEFKKAPKAGDK